jgi:hypothetical protein
MNGKRGKTVKHRFASFLVAPGFDRNSFDLFLDFCGFGQRDGQNTLVEFRLNKVSLPSP